MIKRFAGDPALVGIALLLSLFGLAIVYSAGQTDVATVATNAWRSQIVWIILALGVAAAASRASVRFVDWMTLPLYGLTLVLLMMTLVGFAPADKPKIVVAVMIEFGGHGWRAARIASAVISRYLHATPTQLIQTEG